MSQSCFRNENCLGNFFCQSSDITAWEQVVLSPQFINKNAQKRSVNSQLIKNNRHLAMRQRHIRFHQQKRQNIDPLHNNFISQGKLNAAYLQSQFTCDKICQQSSINALKNRAKQLEKEQNKYNFDFADSRRPESSSHSNQYEKKSSIIRIRTECQEEVEKKTWVKRNHSAFQCKKPRLRPQTSRKQSKIQVNPSWKQNWGEHSVKNEAIHQKCVLSPFLRTVKRSRSKKIKSGMNIRINQLQNRQMEAVFECLSKWREV